MSFKVNTPAYTGPFVLQEIIVCSRSSPSLSVGGVSNSYHASDGIVQPWRNVKHCQTWVVVLAGNPRAIIRIPRVTREGRYLDNKHMRAKSLKMVRFRHFKRQNVSTFHKEKHGSVRIDIFWKASRAKILRKLNSQTGFSRLLQYVQDTADRWVAILLCCLLHFPAAYHFLLWAHLDFSEPHSESIFSSRVEGGL